MSGIEITGLILGTFPLVISALEHYREGFEPLQEWWKFDAEFSSFIEELGTQRARFDLNLEKLLTPFVASDAEMNGLLNEPGPDTWRDSTLIDQVRKRLGGSYEWYWAICRKMMATLRSLEHRLGIQDGKALYIAASKWDHELQRLRISFSRKKFKHVALLSKYNDELQQLLNCNDELVPSRRRRKTPLLTVARSLQKLSQDLYNILLDKWQCSCNLPHETNLLLEGQPHRDRNDDLCLHLLLEVQSVRKRVQVRNKDHISSVTTRNEGPSTGATRLLELKEHVQERPLQSRTHSPQKSNSTLSRLFRGMGISARKQAETNITTHVSQNRQSSPKPVKGVRFDVRAASEEPERQSAPTIRAEIRDICSFLGQSTSNTECVGIFSISPELQLYLYRDQAPEFLGRSCNIITLADILDYSSLYHGIMTRRERFALANTLAFAVLQLQSTSWMNTSWTKHDIIFTHPGSSPKPLLSHAYIQKRFPARETPKPVSPTSCKEALFRLGILLLELTFNRTLESLPFREKYLGPDGTPNKYTDLCTAKDWQRQVEGECGEALSEAIRRCIDCSFGPKADWQSEEFLEAYFGNVVDPLRDTLKQWGSTM